MVRVGIGFDFHPFVEGRPLILGGVKIPHPQGLQGHSDADALLHAVGDALLGAAGLSDIGSYFPDIDPRYKDVASLFLLEKISQLVRGKGYKVGNLDTVVIAEVPHLKPYVPAIRANLSRVLRVPTTDVCVKATTMEARGTIGRKEGIAAQAVALLVRVEE